MIEDKKNKGVVSLLFELLEKKKIPYLVLRNYQNLPERPLAGSDVDLLINKEDEKRYFFTLKNALLKSGGFILLKFRQPNCLSCFIYQKKPFSLGTWIDAFTEISTKGFVFADSKFLLKNRRRHQKGFFIPSSGGEAATLFVKEVFSQPFIRERYRPKISELIKEDKENFFKTLKPYFKEKVIEEMFQICLKEEWKKASKKRKRWWRSLVLNSFFKNPFTQILNFLNFISAHLKKTIAFKGIMIAVIGPDGVGKTTICQNIKKRTRNLFLPKKYLYHSHFGFFPELGKIYAWLFRKQTLEKESNFSQERKIGLPRAFLHLFYYGLENFLAWPWVFWLKIRGNLILFDRYFYDFLAANTFYKTPFWLFWQIAKIIPRPDLVFIIRARPEKIYQRKKELGLEEIKRQLRVFQNPRISKLAPVVFINNEGAIDRVSNKIEDEILKILSKKYDKK